jgi:hypothetical protein
MTDLELQSHRADLHRHTGWPAWDILNDLATESEAANTLGQITRWTGGFAGHWCYRGHADECWLLVSSLHRERKQITLAVGDGIHTTHPPFDARAHEASELADFQISEPTTNAPSDQLATMQHYGASTTSLDFSWSHHVAIWFALKDSMSGKHNDGSRKSSALWAIDLDWLAKAGQAMIDNGDPHVCDSGREVSKSADGCPERCIAR